LVALQEAADLAVDGVSIHASLRLGEARLRATQDAAHALGDESRETGTHPASGSVATM
jgi:hypothetical protein